MGWSIPQEHIILEDWTGKDLQRPGLLRLLELARAGKIQGVIIYTLDRLYRPENDGDEWRVFEVLQQFQAAGVEVAWVDTSIPARGPLSSIFTFLDAWRAGRERRAIIERTSRGLLEKARRGKVISRAAAPYGYRFDPETSTLVLQEDEAKIVRMAFYTYTQERLSLVGLADRLNRLNLEQDRLMRTRGTRQITYDRLAKLAEEARIASQIASANLRIITRAGTPVSEGELTRQSVPLAGAIGLILSVFVVFLVEYVSKARARQAAGRN